MTNNKKLIIRNSTAEFLIFNSQKGGDGIEEAEAQAEKRIPMTMNDWAKKLNTFFKFNDEDVLENTGKVKSEVAKSFAESEFEKYRPIQDKLFESDFDREVKKF